jgi:WD40 repeat protein
LILRDSNISIYYSQGLRKSIVNPAPMKEPHPNGYKIGPMEEKGGKLEGSATLFMVYTGRPYFSADESKFEILKEKGSYAIDKIEKSKSMEISEKEKALVMREEGDVKGKEIVKLDELPEFAAPQGASPDKKFTIGRDAFGPIAMDPESKKLALSTTGTNPTLLLMDVEKKQITPLDLYFDNQVQSVSWSQDGKYLSVEMSGRSGTGFLYIYDAEKESLVDDPMKDALKASKFTISNAYWISGSELVFNASGIGKLGSGDEKKAGSYKFDVKNLNLSKF